MSAATVDSKRFMPGIAGLYLTSMAIKASEPWLNLQCLNPLGVSFLTSL
ncbi:hypothetical protein [Prochlorococcus marinus]|nr:hypothetical protein [Prochlorococcus marinus]